MGKESGHDKVRILRRVCLRILRFVEETDGKGNRDGAAPWTVEKGEQGEDSRGKQVSEGSSLFFRWELGKVGANITWVLVAVGEDVAS